LAQRSLCDADKGRPHFMKTVHALTVFARDHFPLEEELQEQVDYPGLEEHRRQHSEFIKQLFLLVKNFENDEETVTAELVKYLDRWIQEHVITADQKYVVYIRSKNIGLKA
jgi:hemerythrin